MDTSARGDLDEVFPFLSTLSPRAREALLSRSMRRSLADGQILAQDGAGCEVLPFVIRGTLRIYKASETGRELTLYRIERGESCVLSATCILNGGAFPAVAKAEGDTEVLLAPARLLASLADESAAWRRYLFDLYSRRLEDVLTLVAEVAFNHVDARLAAYLLRSGDDGVVARTHGEIADELGTSREVVTRILKDLEVEGLIATSRGRVSVLRADLLEQRAAPV